MLAQSQEQISSVSRIPLVKWTGISPSGLNASSEGEIRVYYDLIHSEQIDFTEARALTFAYPVAPIRRFSLRCRNENISTNQLYNNACAMNRLSGLSSLTMIGSIEAAGWLDDKAAAITTRLIIREYMPAPPPPEAREFHPIVLN